MKDSLLKGYRPKVDCKEAVICAPAFYLYLPGEPRRKRFRQAENGDIRHESNEYAQE